MDPIIIRFNPAFIKKLRSLGTKEPGILGNVFTPQQIEILAQRQVFAKDAVRAGWNGARYESAQQVVDALRDSGIGEDNLTLIKAFVHQEQVAYEVETIFMYSLFLLTAFPASAEQNGVRNFTLGQSANGDVLDISVSRQVVLMDPQTNKPLISRAGSTTAAFKIPYRFVRDVKEGVTPYLHGVAVQEFDADAFQAVQEKILQEFKERKVQGFDEREEEFYLASLIPFLAVPTFREAFLKVLLEKLKNARTDTMLLWINRFFEYAQVFLDEQNYQGEFHALTEAFMLHLLEVEFTDVHLVSAILVNSLLNLPPQARLPWLEKSFGIIHQLLTAAQWNILVDTMAAKLAVSSHPAKQEAVAIIKQALGKDYSPRPEAVVEGQADQTGQQATTALQKNFVESFQVHQEVARLESFPQPVLRSTAQAFKHLWQTATQELADIEQNTDTTKAITARELVVNLSAITGEAITANGGVSSQRPVAHYQTAWKEQVAQAAPVLKQSRHYGAMAADILPCLLVLPAFIQLGYRLVTGNWGMFSASKTYQHVQKSLSSVPLSAELKTDTASSLRL